jgi:hypothetical protein
MKGFMRTKEKARRLKDNKEFYGEQGVLWGTRSIMRTREKARRLKRRGLFVVWLSFLARVAIAWIDHEWCLCIVVSVR